MAVSVLGVAHANVNCTSLAAALPFYRDVLGLTPLIHTAAAPQDGSAFGLAGDVSWDAWMMTDAGGMASTAIDLLEWRTPAPAGRPYPDPRHLGFSRLRLGVDDLDRVRWVVGDASCCRDPDGVLLELVAAPTTRLLAVTVGCSDLGYSLAWYERVLDLDVAPGISVDPVVLGLPPETTADSQLLRPQGQPDAFALELTQWHGPRARIAPGAWEGVSAGEMGGRERSEPTGTHFVGGDPFPPAAHETYPTANHVGIYRVALLVPDAHAAHAELRRLGVACPPPVFLDLGPEVPIDGVWAVFFPDPDGACLELIELPAVTAGAETR